MLRRCAPALLFLAVGAVQAQSPEALDPEAQVARFFEAYATDAEASVDTFFSTNRYIDQNREAVENLKGQLAGVLGLVGPYRGYELVETRRLGTHLVNLLAIVRHDRQPIRFSFTFYRPEGRWQAQNLRYSDEFTDDFERAADRTP